MEFRRSLGVNESPELLESGMGSSLALSCNIRSFVIQLDYGYRYLLEVCSRIVGDLECVCMKVPRDLPHTCSCTWCLFKNKNMETN